MCNDERFYPNPKEYIPERWMRKYKDEAIAKGQDYPFGFKPFGFGPRGCVGQRFAENEIYIGVSKVFINISTEHALCKSVNFDIQMYSRTIYPNVKYNINLSDRTTTDVLLRARDDRFYLEFVIA